MRENGFPLPGPIKKILNRKRARQDVLIVTGFRGIVDATLEVEEGKNYAANDGTQEAWGVDESNQIPGNKESKRPIQLVTAWSAVPVQLFGNSEKTITMDNINEMAARVVDEEIAWEDNRKDRNVKVFYMGLVTVILAVGVVVPILINYLKG